MVTKEMWSGWCEVNNHQLCHGVYTGRTEDVAYVCPCPCHQPERVVKRTLKAPSK